MCKKKRGARRRRRQNKGEAERGSGNKVIVLIMMIYNQQQEEYRTLSLSLSPLFETHLNQVCAYAIATSNVHERRDGTMSCCLRAQTHRIETTDTSRVESRAKSLTLPTHPQTESICALPTDGGREKEKNKLRLRMRLTTRADEMSITE